MQFSASSGTAGPTSMSLGGQALFALLSTPRGPPEARTTKAFQCQRHPRGCIGPGYASSVYQVTLVIPTSQTPTLTSGTAQDTSVNPGRVGIVGTLHFCNPLVGRLSVTGSLNPGICQCRTACPRAELGPTCRKY